MTEKNKENVRMKLKATMEGKRLSRLSEDVAFEKLKEMERKLKNMPNGEKRDRQQIIYSVLREEMEKKVEVYNNMQFGGVIDGGCGYGGGGGSGNDAG